ncbi:OmpA family protein [Photobacterium angustum]|uniref:OmpA family protein n=1 Tax=Photobacterium angustum TaxID=661 RepID=UPI0005EBBB3D|nr:OmpA family protein [Photobacterium angustum]PSV69641.1 nitrate ABC transporter substrate-binding protein [Photobacterium angustum]PSW96795.1 nitrate ABC transporter substrate-binding protein [Photobacterium angustum]PSX03800.1 nitrate ABC transporter substrate-binding protein [Photobacterium angustum]PSX36029.1 nitrate ABC transporter substrate-binding protein [Photobacterium angustum]
MKKSLLACLFAMPLMAQAVTPLNVQTVESRNLPSPRNLTSGPYELPLITWGGDIATIAGNGSDDITQKGSTFSKSGLAYKLSREDVFQKQLEHYISGKTPFLRGSMSMINMAASAVKDNKNLTPVVFYQLTWSSGGDALVVKNNINRASDLCGKTIAINMDGPHLNYAYRILSDAGCDIKQNKFFWTKDLTGSNETPLEAFKSKNVDAAFMITPDALAATSGGGVGDGSEDSVRGASILLSTKTANRVIADVYAVRNDYYQSHKTEIEKLALGLAKSQEMLKSIKTGTPDYSKLMRASAELLLDAPEASADAAALLGDATAVGMTGNISFFTDENNFRNFEQIVNESAEGIKKLGMVKSVGKVLKADLNYAALANGVTTSKTTKPAFDSNQVAKVVETKQKMGTLDDSTVFEFEIFFKPNQNNFNESLYQDQFKHVTQLAQTYAGAVITVEGHSDPMGYLRKKKGGESVFVLNQMKQSAKNLSMTRAQQVRDSIVKYGSDHNVSLDQSQFSVVGHGISNPKTGICGSDPCAPKTEQEWLSNMRVVFRILQVEAEESAFAPL